MLRQCVTPQEACDLLNELLKLDYDCISSLVRHHERCNDAIADHPSVQVSKYSAQSTLAQVNKTATVGFIGILNGMFSIREDGMGAICYEFDDDGKITMFKLTPKGE